MHHSESPKLTHPRTAFPLLSIALIAAALAGISNEAFAVPFTQGNLLVTHRSQLHEYTLDGTLVQTIPVPSADGGRLIVGDVAYDRFGRAHVVNTNHIST